MKKSYEKVKCYTVFCKLNNLHYDEYKQSCVMFIETQKCVHKYVYISNFSCEINLIVISIISSLNDDTTVTTIIIVSSNCCLPLFYTLFR